jgi:hypothetical protein
MHKTGQPSRVWDIFRYWHSGGQRVVWKLGRVRIPDCSQYWYMNVTRLVLLHVHITLGRAIAQTVTHRLSTAAGRIWSQVRLCGIYGAQSGARTGSHQVLWFSLPILIPPTSQHSSSVIWDEYIGPNNDRRTKWTQSHPTPRYKEKPLFFANDCSRGCEILTELERLWKEVLNVMPRNLVQGVGKPTNYLSQDGQDLNPGRPEYKPRRLTTGPGSLVSLPWCQTTENLILVYSLSSSLRI